MDRGKQKKILMACGSPWNGILKLGSHHIAREFVRLGYKVAFISGPISPFHVMRGLDSNLKTRFDVYLDGGQFDCNESLWHYVPGAFLTHSNRTILRNEWFARHWHKLTFPNILRKIEEASFSDVDLLYIDNSIHACWLPLIKYRKCMLRLADNNSGFKQFTGTMQKLELELMRWVDVVLCASKSIEEKVKHLSLKDVRYFPNGVNYVHFQNVAHNCPLEYKHIPKPIAIYVGALDFWFDYSLLNKAAESIPALSFVIIGPSEYAKTRLKPLPNIYILGPRNFDDIPSYLQNADVGLIPFNVKQFPELVNGVNPLKMYEYMACGLPVVASSWETIKKLQSPAILYQHEYQFIDSLRAVIRQVPDKKIFHAYAAQNDWSNRIRDLIAIVNG